ncbi:hypothetical protein DU002_00990 [Corallincola holothuriorum]|uniref:Uncharacterized protein n=1 Tax=Corallincola holothuriorum TaxID=2282215 RepID=A0A368NQZ8_9GAMM|nr:CsiV family protein [Corallincola holothuriorum]RCU52576.1 hypothetical protein DU002_00990 [Corallincola holothuriorum]
MKRNRILTLALAPAVLMAGPLFSASVVAEEEEPRWFEVEVILFSRNVPADSVNEHWPSEANKLDTQNAPDLLSALLFPAEEVAPVDDSYCIPADQLTTDPVMDGAAATPDSLEAGTPEVAGETKAPLSDSEQIPQPCPPSELEDAAPATYAKTDVPEIVVAPALPDFDVSPYLIDDQSLQLVAQRKVIERRPEFKMMLHTGWRQAMVPRKQSAKWHLFAGKDFTDQFLADGTLRHKPELATSNQAPCPVGTVTIDGECIISDNAASENPAPGANADAPAAPQPLTTEEVQANITEMLAAQETELAAAMAAQVEVESADTPIMPLWQLDGLFRVYLEHYLYIDADFDYRIAGERELPLLIEDPSSTYGSADNLEMTDPLATPEPILAIDNLEQSLAAETLPLTQQEDPEAGGTLVTTKPTEGYLYRYRLSQSRRLRSGELHYFDHPLVGILVQIRPHDYREPPTPTEVDTSAAVDATTSTEVAAPASDTQPAS